MSSVFPPDGGAAFIPWINPGAFRRDLVNITLSGQDVSGLCNEDGKHPDVE
jgi:hypothetical protein